MKYLVIGGTGTVGSRVVSRLAEQGAAVRSLTRSAEKARALPQGVEPAIGDLDDPASLSPAFQGADSVFMLNPVSPAETQQGLHGVELAKKAGARRFVYMSVFLPGGSEHIPHFASKTPVEEAVKASGMEWTILRPNNFFQNDYWYKDAMLQYGVYPQPLGSAGTARVDVRDIADAAVNALTRPGHAGQVYPLNGSDALTGEDMARTWSKHLGREVRYGGDDLDAWETQARQSLPEWMVHDFRIMYEFFQRNGFRPTPEEDRQQAKGVGHPPRSFEDFVAETASGWKGSLGRSARPPAEG